MWSLCKTDVKLRGSECKISEISTSQRQCYESGQQSVFYFARKCCAYNCRMCVNAYNTINSYICTEKGKIWHQMALRSHVVSFICSVLHNSLVPLIQMHLKALKYIIVTTLCRSYLKVSFSFSFFFCRVPSHLTVCAHIKLSSSLVYYSSICIKFKIFTLSYCEKEQVLVRSVILAFFLFYRD